LPYFAGHAAAHINFEKCTPKKTGGQLAARLN
jgi:hypothetical protein